MDICPDSATVKRNGVLQVVSPESVAVGEIIVVKPGEKIPLDGIVVDGESMLDTKALTGESVREASAKAMKPVRLHQPERFADAESHKELRGIHGIEDH